MIAAEMRSYSTSRDSITEITKSFENYRENFVEKKNSVDSNENPIKEIANKIKGKNENDQQIPYRPKEDENRDTVDEGEIDLWEGIIPEEGGVKPPALPNDENADDPTQPVVPLRPDDE